LQKPVQVLIAIAIFAIAAPALADSFDPTDMVFPVDGEYRVTDSFGDCRGTNCSRSHEGVDIMAAKGVPVVAVEAGVVTWISSGPSDCCDLGISHGDGWSTRYIHLNDDAQDSNGNYIDNTDGQGWGIAPGIEHGTEVEKGQLIGWVGDSGNAAETVTHLHFELRDSGTAIDPYDYLILAESNWTGQFRDDDGSVHENNIDKIFNEGITVGCNPPLNHEFCPQRNITRGEMAAFIARALNLSEMTGGTKYTDVEGNIFENAIDKAVTAGIGFGCTADKYCPDEPLLRDEMAETLVRAFGYNNPDNIDFFGDDNGNRFEASINKLASSGITVGCNPPENNNFCPDRQLSRAEMATFFVRALDL
jgi:hypothetical protein